MWVLYGYGHGRLGCFPLPVPMGRLGRLTHRSVQQSVGGPRVLTGKGGCTSPGRRNGCDQCDLRPTAR